MSSQIVHFDPQTNRCPLCACGAAQLTDFHVRDTDTEKRGTQCPQIGSVEDACGAAGSLRFDTVCPCMRPHTFAADTVAHRLIHLPEESQGRFRGPSR
jgi:hypothetical protein